MKREWEEVKYHVAVANRILAETGLAAGFRASLGHASLRLPTDPDKFIVKGRGYEVDALFSITPEQMIVCDLEGNKVDGPLGTTQCMEVKMHSCIYKLYPHVKSVVHVHPHYTILATTLRKRLRPMNQEGIQLVRNELPVWDHVKTVQTDDEGMEVAALLGDGKAILLRGHGATTVGNSLEESVMNMLQLEEQAKMNYWAYSVAGEDHAYIEDALIDEMTNRTPAHELPHFKPYMPAGGRAPRVGGVWEYYTRLVTGDPSANPPISPL
ncbi:MAG: class II aldolase/adducin family protein [Chloroflexi bacterium]|nr:class II aldolase/adducin family protein [Chloroflexota bacterium]